MSGENNISIAKTCKFLGLRTDPRSLASYPSIANCCYGCLPEATPNLVHQREYCLDENHKGCPVYLAENIVAMPRELLHKASQKSNSFFNVWSAIALLLLLAIAGVWIFLLLPQLSNAQVTPAWTAPVMLSTELPTPAAKTSTAKPTEQSPTATITNTASPIPSPSATPEIVLLPLETILGTNYKVIIHRIAEGESLSSLAQTNGTTDAAILNATYKLAIPLWIGKLIVIPVQNRSWKDQPALEPYQVTQGIISLDELAQLLGIDAKLLKYYNGCENCLIQQGSWVVIPRAP
jgi:LysM repeat protein